MTPSISAPVQSSSARPVAISHIHATGESCPFCEQPIPRDRFEHIKARIADRQREERQLVEVQLQERFAREKSELAEQMRTEARAELDRERESLQAREIAAREEGRRVATEAAREDVERLQARIDQAEATNAASQRAESALKTQLADMQREREEAIAQERQTADTRVIAAREEGRVAAESALRDEVSAAEQARSDANARANAAQAQVALEKEAADARVAAARDEGKAAGESALQETLSANEKARTDAEARATAAEERVSTLQQSHQTELAERLKEQRDALEQAKTDAVNAEKSVWFEEKNKLSSKIDDLQRQVDIQTAEELGEGAEIDLYDTLKQQFPDDRIDRIKHGQPGADILQTVIHNGQECGTIIYDSKNHKAWRNDFATKLAADQMAAKADHAILSTRKFPNDTGQLHVQDGIILAAPSRVAALAIIVRQHVIATHTLRLSDQARTQKTAELYAFITSGRFRDVFKRIDANAEKLLEMQVKEKRAHETMWKNQGEVIRSIQKSQAEIINEIEVIIGTSEDLERVVHE
jgi:hypothetical protein